MGATAQWKTETPEAHTIRVQYSRHSGRVLVYVDDVCILRGRDDGGNCNWDEPFEYEFQIVDTFCKILVGGTYCHLWIDGKQIEHV